MKQLELPHMVILTGDEIGQAICEYVARRHLGIDPERHDLSFQVAYRPVKGASMVASLNVTDVAEKMEPDRKEE